MRKKILVIDWETTGIRDENVLEVPFTHGPQGFQLGAIVADCKDDWSELGSFEMKMKFLGTHSGVQYGEYPNLTWDTYAERIHYHTARSLVTEKHPKEVCGEFINFLSTHYDLTQPIMIAGHNPMGDRYYTKQLMFFGSMLTKLKLMYRMIDTSTLGLMIFDTESSDELFKAVSNKVRTSHNALEDARLTCDVLRTVTRAVMGGEQVVAST